jgi:hypothetical protein
MNYQRRIIIPNGRVTREQAPVFQVLNKQVSM